ncbi:hypothetical protein NIIDNTM18_29780 [Mycolicibacterium litorale]|uniref:Uncharacterized protein n=1 Tax=Mycolicibacterium litorale TaxID=758802 RepID=A0A6S6PAH6_9MYCO|nr:hypothetical protein NIIDNTM18_29780 [Mycolicibacterium litorale]
MTPPRPHRCAACGKYCVPADSLCGGCTSQRQRRIAAALARLSPNRAELPAQCHGDGLNPPPAMDDDRGSDLAR